MSILRYVASAFRLIPPDDDEAEPPEPTRDLGPLRESDVLDLLDQTIYRRDDLSSERRSRSERLQ